MQRGIVTADATEQIDVASRLVTVGVTQTDHVVPRVVRSLDDAGIDVIDVAVRQPTLDDVFLQLTGHRSSADDESESATNEEGDRR